MFVDAVHRNNNSNGRSISCLFLVVGSTPTIWSSKFQTKVQTSKFGSNFIALKKAVKESVMFQYYVISMGIKVF